MEPLGWCCCGCVRPSQVQMVKDNSTTLPTPHAECMHSNFLHPSKGSFIWIGPSMRRDQNYSEKFDHPCITASCWLNIRFCVHLKWNLQNSVYPEPVDEVIAGQKVVDDELEGVFSCGVVEGKNIKGPLIHLLENICGKCSSQGTLKKKSSNCSEQNSKPVIRLSPSRGQCAHYAWTPKTSN